MIVELRVIGIKIVYRFGVYFNYVGIYRFFEQVFSQHAHSRTDFQNIFIAFKMEGICNFLCYIFIRKEMLSKMLLGFYFIHFDL
ncbi:hypothetical protein D3C86_1634150 [compost metagenome]